MKALEEKILREGTVLPGNILKVGSFLNHQIDVDFLMEMGREIACLFADAKVTKVFTIETSGIPVAMATAAAMHVPMVYAKKHKSGNLSGDLYTTVVHSYTHNTDYNIVVSKDYIQRARRSRAQAAPLKRAFRAAETACAPRVCAWSPLR